MISSEAIIAVLRSAGANNTSVSICSFSSADPEMKATSYLHVFDGVALGEILPDSRMQRHRALHCPLERHRKIFRQRPKSLTHSSRRLTSALSEDCWNCRIVCDDHAVLRVLLPAQCGLIAFNPRQIVALQVVENHLFRSLDLALRPLCSLTRRAASFLQNVARVSLTER